MKRLSIVACLIAACLSAGAQAAATRDTSTNARAGYTVGSDAIATGQVAAGTTAVRVVDARIGRSSVDVTVDGAVKCYLGGPTVTTTTGFPLQAVAGATKTIANTAPVWIVCASAVTVGFMDNY